MRALDMECDIRDAQRVNRKALRTVSALLQLERWFSGATCFGYVIWLFGVVLILLYHSIVILSYFQEECSTAVWVSFALDLLVLLSLWSILWHKPMTTCLGLSNNVLKTRQNTESRQWVTKFSDIASGSLDKPTKAILFGSYASFVLGVMGEAALFFSGVGANDAGDDHTEPTSTWLAFIYSLSAVFCTLVVSLVSGHVALAHNLFARQLVEFSIALREDNPEESREAGMEKFVVDEAISRGIGAIDLGIEEGVGLLRPRRMALGCKPAGFSSTSIRLIHQDFRFRQKSLAQSVHLRLGFIFVALLAEILIMVLQGFETRKQDFSFLVDAIVVLNFCSLGFSLFSMVFAMARCLHISREEVGHNAVAWSLVAPNGQDRSAAIASAQYIRDHPIRFYFGIIEFDGDMARGIIFLLLGVGAVFLGVRVPYLRRMLTDAF